ncbi:hypothetical protein HKX48_002333, partial [Thoreauomyces humboldtii]
MPFWSRSKSKRRRAITPPPPASSHALPSRDSRNSNDQRSFFGFKRRSPSPHYQQRQSQNQSHGGSRGQQQAGHNSYQSQSSHNGSDSYRSPTPSDDLGDRLRFDFDKEFDRIGRSRSPSQRPTSPLLSPLLTPRSGNSSVSASGSSTPAVSTVPVVVVTSTGPSCVIQCDRSSTVSWLLERASKRLPRDHSILVEARAPDGRRAQNDELVLDVCGDTKILVATVATADYARRASVDSPRLRESFDLDDLGRVDSERISRRAAIVRASRDLHIDVQQKHRNRRDSSSRTLLQLEEEDREPSLDVDLPPLPFSRSSRGSARNSDRNSDELRPSSPRDAITHSDGRRSRDDYTGRMSLEEHRRGSRDGAPLARLSRDGGADRTSGELSRSPGEYDDSSSSRNSRDHRWSRGSREERRSRGSREFGSRRSPVRTASRLSGLDSVMEDLAKLADKENGWNSPKVDAASRENSGSLESQHATARAAEGSSSLRDRTSHSDLREVSRRVPPSDLPDNTQSNPTSADVNRYSVERKLNDILNSVGMEIDDALNELNDTASLFESPRTPPPMDDITPGGSPPTFRSSPKSRRLTRISRASALDIFAALEQQEQEETMSEESSGAALSSYDDDFASRRVSRISRASALEILSSMHTTSDRDDDSEQEDEEDEEDDEEDDHSPLTEGHDPPTSPLPELEGQPRVLLNDLPRKKAAPKTRRPRS